MDLKEKDGCYTLPETLSVFGTEEIKYLKIERNMIFLLRSPSDPNGFVLARYMSLDKILDSKRPEDLVASITLPDGRGYAEILSRSGTPLLKGLDPEHVGNIAIRFCTVRNYRLHFFSLLFAAQRPDQAVDNVKRSLAGAGPLSIKIDGIDVMYANVERDPMWMERSKFAPGVEKETEAK
ncbi:MAG TPA: hypothetical protein VFM90_09580 [Cyclobacteriaceae bacterium]|nr:hypothetical protein [Cyclobacteriaceae bacterium]